MTPDLSKTLTALAGRTYPDYLNAEGSRLPPDCVHAIRRLRQERSPGILAPRFAALHAALSALPAHKTKHFDPNQAAVTIGDASELSDLHAQALDDAVTAFIPWKKGPLQLFGRYIDTEWRSDMKWERVRNAAGSLKGLRIADVGCHNGYFMLRMLADDPSLVIGFEPEEKLWLSFHLLQRYVQDERLAFELLGVEHFDLYPGFFHRIFCMGILYHHTDPVGLLRKMHAALTTGGKIIIDCQGIAGDDPVALVPRSRYAKARGIWFLPTRSCLEHWTVRAGFKDVRCFFDEALSVEEQRATPFAPIQSLADFLDPHDHTKTIEGYPAPRRIYLVATK